MRPALGPVHSFCKYCVSALREHFKSCDCCSRSLYPHKVHFVNDVKMYVIGDLFYLASLSVPDRGVLKFPAGVCTSRSFSLFGRSSAYPVCCWLLLGSCLSAYVATLFPFLLLFAQSTLFLDDSAGCLYIVSTQRIFFWLLKCCISVSLCVRRPFKQ